MTTNLGNVGWEVALKLFSSAFRPLADLDGDGRLHFLTVLLVIAANGLQAGVYTVLIADLAGALRLSPGALGVALAALSAASIVGSALGGRLADWIGRRAVLAAGVAGSALFYLALAFVENYVGLIAVMALGGVLLSFFDLSTNTLGGDFELRHDKKVMTRLHVGKDFAAAVGSLGSGVALALGASFRSVYAALGLLLLALAVASLRLPLPEPVSGSGRREGEPRGPSPALWAVRGVVLAALFVGLVSLTEAALEGYSSLYLRDVLSSGVLLGAVGITVFQLARMLGQVGSSVALRRVGEKGVLIAAGLGVATGIAVLVATRSPWIGAGGLLLIGLFAAPISPIAYSLAARAAPDRVGQSVALVWGSFYVAFLLGPLVVGVLADLLSLRVALALFIPTSLAIAGLALRKL